MEACFFSLLEMMLLILIYWSRKTFIHNWFDQKSLHWIYLFINWHHTNFWRRCMLWFTKIQEHWKPPLLFIRLHLLGTNGITVQDKHRYFHLCIYMVWFTSMSGVNITPKRNIVSETIFQLNLGNEVICGYIELLDQWSCRAWVWEYLCVQEIVHSIQIFSACWQGGLAYKLYIW